MAAYLAEVSKALEGRGHPPEEVAGFLARILFAMFAEDVGLLPPDSFTGLLREAQAHPDSFAPTLSQLFEAMDEGLFAFGLKAQIKRFNGAFYKDRRAFPLRREEIGTLLLAAGKDWRQVEPAIFGTLLEQALDPRERGRLGAHYTPRPYVERLVQATVMQPLREDWAAARAAAEDRQASGDARGAGLELLAFHDHLTRTRVLDPACGTGNFLYVTLELMKALESEVLEARAGLDVDDDLVGDAVKRGVDPRQFYGLELNPRAAAIAELVLWIGYLQASYRRDPDYNPRDPVLSDFGTVNPAASKRRPGDPAVDAVLQSDGDVIGGGGTSYPDARLPAWPEAEFIVGNPPFIGGKDIRAELGDAYAEALWALNPQMDGGADFVMYWWDRAADVLTRKGSPTRRFGLVTTNSITQVFQRRTLARWMDQKHQNKRALSLTFAVDDHPWTKATRDAAAVWIAMTVAVAGKHDGELATVAAEAAVDTDAPQVELQSAHGSINADLTVGIDVTAAVELHANDGMSSRGVSLHGSGFIVTSAEASHLGLGREDRPGLDQHIRPYLNGRDLTGRSRGAMVIDLFGLAAEQVRNRYPEVYQHIALSVKPERDRNNRATYRENWWIFGEPRRELRPALHDLSRYIATVETSKHRTFQFIDGEVLPDNRLVCFALSDAAHLAVLSSSLHVGWSLATGGTLEDRPIYTKSQGFDPFPFPAWTAVQHAALAEAGEALEAFRKRRLAEQPDLTLTRLYNALQAHREGRTPTAQEARDFESGSVLILAELHADIDRLTLDAYGWSDLDPADDQELLGRLVALNAERAAEEARGLVRWLRPDYQTPRLGRRQVAGPAPAGDLVPLLPPAPAARTRWPAEARAKLLMLRGALAEAPAPQTAAALAARFSGRGVAPEIARLLAALQRDGQVRAGPRGYELLRAA